MTKKQLIVDELKRRAWKRVGNPDVSVGEMIGVAADWIIDEQTSRDAWMKRAQESEQRAAVEPAAKPALEDTPFLPINPEVLKDFTKQMVDWGIVWVKYSPEGAKVIPHEEIYQQPENRNGDV